jgi:hypothetical protein
MSSSYAPVVLMPRVQRYYVGGRGAVREMRPILLQGYFGTILGTISSTTNSTLNSTLNLLQNGCC